MRARLTAIAAGILALGLFVIIEPSAFAATTLPGTVSCQSAGGVITFTPALTSLSSKLTTNETITVSNGLTSCVPSSGEVPATIHGSLSGGATVFTPGVLGANSCDAFFPASGINAITPTPTPTWKAKWSIPQSQNQNGVLRHAHRWNRRNGQGQGNGNGQGNSPSPSPTLLASTTLNVANSGGTISIGISGTTSGSFSSPATGTLSLTGSVASWSYSVVKAVCGTTTGLKRLVVGAGITDSL